MRVNKTEAKLLNNALEHWQADKLLSAEQANTLKNSLIVQSFDWKKLAKHSFIISVLCVLGAVLTLFADNLLFNYLFELFSTKWGVTIIASIVAVVCLHFGEQHKKHTPEQLFQGEALLTLGGIFIGIALITFGSALGSSGGLLSLLFLFGTIIYLWLAAYYSSNSLWLFALLSSSLWLGIEISFFFEDIETNHLFLIYLGWGILLTTFAQQFQQKSRFSNFAPMTFRLGLFVVFCNLWLLSIISLFGGEAYFWRSIIWSFVLTAAAFLAFFWGIKKENIDLKTIGYAFLLLNIYTKYIQFFWDALHISVFFAILAASFWLVGNYAEKIWAGHFWKGGDDLLDQ